MPIASEDRSTARLVVAATVALLLFVATPAKADVDVSGRWRFVFDYSAYGMVFERVITLAQSGTTLTVVGAGSYDGGTIDPVTGAMHLEGTFGCSPTPDTLDAVASADGMAISGTFFETMVVSRYCWEVFGPVEATRIVDTCGNGVVDAGEACDGGPAGTPCCTEYCTARPAGTSCPVPFACSASASCNGTGACVQTPKAAGAVCRSATNVCDTPETCDGTSLTCPPESSPTEPDVDDDGVLDGCDTCLGAPLEDVQLSMGSFRPNAPKDFLKLRASVRIPSDSFLHNPAVEPEFLSKIVAIRDATGAAIVDERIPGTTSSSAAPSWKRKGTRWTFTNRGLTSTQVASLQMGPSRRDPNVWDVRVAIARGALPDAAGTPPYAVEVELYRTGSPSEECGRLVFGLPGSPSPSCSAPNGRGVIRCR